MIKMKLKIMIMALLLITGIGSAVNRLPATEFVGDVDMGGNAITNATGIHIYSSIVVYKSGSDTVAIQDGEIIATGTDDDVLDAAWAAMPYIYGSIIIVGDYNLSSGHNFSDRDAFHFDASRARFAVDKNITGIQFFNTRWSRMEFNALNGNDSTGAAIKISGKSSCNHVAINKLAKFEHGVLITDGTSLLDNSIYFTYIEECDYGIALVGNSSGDVIEGTQVRGSFINAASVAGVYLAAPSGHVGHSDIEIVAIDPIATSGTYGVYTSGTGYYNNVRITGFLDNAAVYELYDLMGHNSFTVPAGWGKKYVIASTSTLISSGMGSTNFLSHVDAPPLYRSDLITVNSQNTDLIFNVYRCTITDNENGTFRMSATGTNPIIEMNMNVSGNLGRYVIVRSKLISGDAPGNSGAVYYSTAGHGVTQDFYKSIPGATLIRTTHVLDMWSLSAGGSDWKDSEILTMRISHPGATNGSIIDYSFVIVANMETPGLTV